MQPTIAAKSLSRSHSRRPGRWSAPAVLAAALAAAMPALSSAQTVSASTDLGWVKGRVLIMPRAGISQETLSRIIAAYAGKAYKMGQSQLHVVDLPSHLSETVVAAELAANPAMKFAELDRRVPAHLAPSDPYFGSQWHLARIGSEAAWDISRGKGATIAILDTGVNGSHYELGSRMVPGWNFYDNNADTGDTHGHGTAVAGTAAAALNNSSGVASVAGEAMIMPVRVSDPTGYAYYSTISQGLTYAADRGVRVANISFGVAGSASVQSSADYMRGKGGLVIVSAGNNGVNENLPETASMIPVSATDGNDARTSWSSYGSFVKISAPGAGIYTTHRDGNYGAQNGTSFASPIVAGTVALMMSANPKLAQTQIESLLHSNSVDLGAAGRDIHYGHGRVNAAAAVKAAVAATPLADRTVPVSSISAPLGSTTVSGTVPVDVKATDNVGVARVELRVNNNVVAIDDVAPFLLAWESTGTPNGAAKLNAYAYDAAGNVKASTTVTVNVANPTATVVADTTPPTVAITNPVAGKVAGTVTISVSAADNNGATGLSQTIYINNVAKASAKGGTMSYSWDTTKDPVGTYTIKVIATDAAGNAATNTVMVSR